MTIPIEKEPKDSGVGHLVREHCCFCREPTNYWTKLKDRKPGAQVACCRRCAQKHGPKDVPTKLEWFQNVEQATVTATAKQSTARLFVLNRKVDPTGTSGTGIVAEGVRFSNGKVALHWLSHLGAVNVYDSMDVCEQLHGHGGNTEVVWREAHRPDSLKLERK